MHVVPAGCSLAQFHVLCSFGEKTGDPFLEDIKKTITVKFVYNNVLID